MAAVFFASFFWVLSLGAQENSIQDLKKNLLSLRNTDPEIHRLDQWLILAEKFEWFIKHNEQGPEIAPALFSTGVLYKELVRKDSNYARKSIEHLARLHEEFPDSPLAADAIIKLSELYESVYQDSRQVQRLLKKVIERYPSSEQADFARARLKNKSGDHPTPQARNTDETLPLLVIDPGHGGEDWGARGIGGILEKDLALSLALEIERAVIEAQFARVKLTRRRDVFVPLAERTNFANDFEAAAFLSVHLNASPSSKVSGIETFYLDNTDDKSSLALAEKENASYQKEFDDLQFMLSDLVQSAKLEESILLANVLQQNIYRKLSPRWNIGRNLGVKKAPFYVLVGAHMPCILIELGFVDNSNDGANLSRKAYREDLVKAIVDALKSYFEKEVK